jgi:hypothetical protein
LLFIPAYWYHHVEAMISPAGTSHAGKTTSTEHLSISANFWSTASMDFLIAMSTPFPFAPKFDDDVATAIKQIFPPQYPVDKVIDDYSFVDLLFVF